MNWPGIGETRITIQNPGEELLVFKPDGSVYHKGKLIGNDVELLPIVQKVFKQELHGELREKITVLEAKLKLAKKHMNHANYCLKPMLSMLCDCGYDEAIAELENEK